MAQFVLSAFADEASPTIEGQIKALLRNGIRYIEPRNVEGSLLQKTDAELEEIHQALVAHGIGISAFGSPIGKVDLDTDFDAYLEGDVKRAFEVCHILGAQRIRMFSFFCKPEALETKKAQVMEQLRRIAEFAKQEGIVLCHENESRIYGCQPKEVKELLEAIPSMQGIFDPANYIQNDADPQEGLDATFTRFIYAHIKDARYSTHGVVPAGCGDGQVVEVLKRIDAHTEDTIFLTIEPHLHEFLAFKEIDDHQMKPEFEFANGDEAFDFAVTTLKNILKSLGFQEGDNGIWKK